MLICTLLTFAMCADPNVAGEIAFGDLAVPIVWSHVRVRSCLDVGQDSPPDGAGLTRFETTWSTRETSAVKGGYSGRLVVRISSARIELSAFTWDRMSKPEAEALRDSYRATLWHELGHLETAKKSIDAANAGAEFFAATAAAYNAIAKRRGSAAVERMNADQQEYDRVAGHGLRQDALPLPLAGSDTVIVCSQNSQPHENAFEQAQSDGMRAAGSSQKVKL